MSSRSWTALSSRATGASGHSSQGSTIPCSGNTDKGEAPVKMNSTFTVIMSTTKFGNVQQYNVLD